MTTGTTAAARPPSPFAVFRIRDFRLMWIGQFVETSGSALTALAASIFVYRLTGSALSVGLMLVATALPSVVLGLVAGVVVDRYNRRKIMVIAEVARAALTFLIPVLVPLHVAWLYVLVMLSSTVGQFFDPAHESVLPEVAPEEELAAANSLMAISSFGATAIGFALSGLIASQANIMWAFYVNGVTFLLSGLCILLLRAPGVAPAEAVAKDSEAAGAGAPADAAGSVGAVVRNLGAGMRALVDTPILRSLLLTGIPTMVSFGLTNSLLLPFALRALKASEFEYGMQEALTSVGFVAGSLLMAGVFDRMREGPWMVLSYIGMGLLGALYALSRSVPYGILLLALSGFCNAPAAIGRRVAVQRNTPTDMRGRVNSAFFVVRDVFYLIGMLAAGLADVMDIRLLFMLSSLVLLGVAAWILTLPGLRQEAGEWRRALALLRAAPTAPVLGAGRAATLADLDALIGRLPALGRLSPRERQELVARARVAEAPAGTAILRYGETSDSAYFLLAGRAIAGIATDDGGYRSLSSMGAGDFFGEIAALTGAPRTADVVAEEPSTLLEVPATALRNLMPNPAMRSVILARMAERLNRTSVSDLPRFAGYDQRALRDLRAAPPESLAQGE
ncbi:MAG: MFS transporter, partial [Chloroflexota bacterium]